jgi:hypothetical protein
MGSIGHKLEQKMVNFTRFLLGSLILLTAAIPVLAQEKKNVTIKMSKDHLDFLIGAELVTRYHVSPSFSKPIFWPVRAPNGAPLTRSWPMVKDIPGESNDHVHQKSAWFCHGDVIPEGIELRDKIKGVEGVDFWSEAKGHGNIVCTKIEEPKNQGAHARVATHNEWRMADGTKIMDETRVISFHDVGKARLLVLDIDLEASVCPITFGDTKEGSMGIRINDQIRADKGKGKLQNAEGKVGEKECWGRRSAWTDYSGPVSGNIAGLAILDDPRNPYPSCWHIRGYGLNAANPFGRDKAKFPDVLGQTDLVRLAKGGHLKLRYGLVLHDGDAITGGVAEAYRRFVDLRGKD